jgi:DNA-directed RNA polymerase subunit H (RpoH/RPB5)
MELTATTQPPTVVYKNVVNEFAKYRKLVISSEPLATSTPPDIDNVSTILSSLGYWRIDLVDAETRGKTTVIFILSVQAPQMKDKKTLTTFLMGASSDGVQPVEVIIIGPDALSKKNNLMEGVRDASAGISVPINVYPYSIFLYIVPSYPLSPSLRILSPSEARDVLFEKKILTSDMSKIGPHDALGVWYGVRRGDIVELTYPSETALKELGYLYAG